MEKFKVYGHMNLRDDGTFNFHHIYGAPSLVEFCDGKEKHTVYELTFEVHANQVIDNEPIEYWGWVEKDEVSMIYAKYFLLDMCFPAGAKRTEEAGRGKAVKFNLINFKNI